MQSQVTTRTLPGTRLDFPDAKVKSSGKARAISVSLNVPFEQIKDTLSSRPLRRPNRTKPLENGK